MTESDVEKATKREFKGKPGGNRNLPRGVPKAAIEVQKPKTSEEAVPVLRYGPNNNYVDFKKRLSFACLEKYQGLGRLIEDEAYWAPEEVIWTTYDAKKDPEGIVRTTLLEMVK